MSFTRSLSLARNPSIYIPLRGLISKTPPAKMSYELRRALLDDADPHFRTRIHDATYEAHEIMRKSTDFSVTDRVVVPEETDMMPLNSIPKEQLEKREVRIYQPAKSATQSGTFGAGVWRLEVDNQARWENPLMGWTSSGDPLSNLSLDFPSAETAEEYCRNQGWNYTIEEAHKTFLKPRSYSNNFSWNKRTRRACK